MIQGGLPLLPPLAIPHPARQRDVDDGARVGISQLVGDLGRGIQRIRVPRRQRLAWFIRLEAFRQKILRVAGVG